MDETCSAGSEWTTESHKAKTAPLINIHRTPMPALTIRPTHGSFLDGFYTDESLLHVGISDSRGVVYHFDEHGLHTDQDGWEQCLAIPLLPFVPKMHPTSFDAALKQYFDECKSTPVVSEYTEDRNNCFDFVLDFLQTTVFPYTTIASSKVELCQHLIGPAVDELSKYLSPES